MILKIKAEIQFNNWGISKLFSIGQQGILEIGIPGYDQWQISNDSGTDIIYNAGIRPQVHGVGLELVIP